MLKVLLTGATGRIGKAIIKEIVSESVILTIVGRDKATLEKIAQQNPDSIKIIVADLAVTDQLKNVVEQAHEFMQGIDVLINNAAVFGFNEFSQLDPTIINDVLDINLKAPLYLTHFALPHLMKNQQSLVINIASIAGKEYFATAAAYCASKFGLFGFAGSLFKEVRTSGVKVCTIAPGQITLDENAAQNTLPAEDVAHVVKFIINYPSKKSCPSEIILQAQL